MRKIKTKIKCRMIALILLLSLFVFLSPLQNDTLLIQAASGTFTEDFTATTYMDTGSTNVSGWGDGTIANTRKQPTIIGSKSSALIGFVLDVCIDGNYAYITDELTGLKIVDISDPSAPSEIGRYDTSGVAYGVQVAGDCAFIADYGGDSFLHKNFLVVNITDPTNPSLLGNCSTYLGASYLARGLAVDGNLVYVANMAGGLSVINVTDSSNPTQIGMRNTPGTSYDVCVEGDFAYIADGANGLVIVNITDPTNPTIATTFSTSISTAVSVIVEGNYAYVVDTDNGLIVVDITFPKTPSFAGEYNNNNDVTDADVYGNFLYITDIYDGLLIVNISNPTSPSLISSFSITGFTQAIFIEGCNAYLACYNGGFQVAKIADISTPTLIGSYDTPGSAYDVVVSGDYAYIAAYHSGLQIIDISNPSSPTYVGSYDTPGTVEEVFISGDYAYLADYTSGVQILNISDPSNPLYISSYDTPGFANNLFVSGNAVFVADDAYGLHIIDISNPASPQLISTFDTQDDVNGVFVLGSIAFVTDRLYGLHILDVSNLSSPFLIGQYNPSGSTTDVYVSGNYAYLANGATGLIVVDISDLSSPALAGSYDTPGSAQDVHISGDYAYLADGSGDVQILNITDPSSPTFTNSYTTPSNTLGVYVSGDYLYATEWSTGMQILNIRNNKVKQFDSICEAQSSVIYTSSASYSIASAVLTSTDTTPSSTSISYYLSADNGGNWELVTPNVKHDLVNIGNQLKWRAVLTTSDVLETPLIYVLSINYTTILDAPALLNPIDGHIPDDYTPAFTWSGINGESNYLFQLDTSTSFLTPLLNLSLSSTSTSYTPSSILAPDTYYWRVAGIDSESDVGIFSSYRSIIIFEDTNAPLIDHPIDVSYEVGSIGNSITWNPSDSNPYYYNITRNSTLLEHGIIWDGGSITIDVDGLAEGVYNFTCFVYDQGGLFAWDSVFVTIEIPVIGEFTFQPMLSIMFITAILVVIYSKKKSKTPKNN